MSDKEALKQSELFLRALAENCQHQGQIAITMFREGQHGENPFTGEVHKLEAVEFRELLEPTGIFDHPEFNRVFEAFVRSVIDRMAWCLIAGHDQAGEDEDVFAYKIRQYGGPDLVDYLHELWSDAKRSL